MIGNILSKIFGSANERTLKLIQPIVEQVNQFDESMKALSDEVLAAKTAEFKKRLSEGISLDYLLPEAFAVVREMARRKIKMRHYDVQIIGGVVLHQGKIAEMATGEGKTLVATLPIYLNALSGKGVHLVTVNDYLAKRDCEWMRPVYESLGLTVGAIQHDMDPAERKQMYACDITYGTNNEFGFDYLRDNMVANPDQRVKREMHYAIVDEVDSILIDEARTPLIISGPAEESTDKYYKANRVVPQLKGTKIMEREMIEARHQGKDIAKGFDFIVDEKAHNAHLTEEGEVRVCELLGIDNLHDMETLDWRHHVLQALKAHNLFQKDVDYVIKDNKVLIVDEFTGRLMPGRRWSDGLHQAVEAKEGLQIERENQTLATITLQNYFRMYKKLAGMTGTALTEAQEFENIYKLDTVVIPTNKPVIRIDNPDVIYRTEKEKFNAVADDIAERHKEGRPCLVGTISIEKSEKLSSILSHRRLQHTVLNAKYHEKEAEIVARAGQPGAITIATNMAGRGTDIVLGEGVAKKGGLHVIGTERHEARRIDNQLRGRCARQGDPGSARFYICLEDDLWRLFGSNPERLKMILGRLGMEDGLDIQHPWITKSIESAQKRVEGRNFEIRKNLLEYDDVMNRQREIIYAERDRVLLGSDMKEHFKEVFTDVVAELWDIHNEKLKEDEEIDESVFWKECELIFGLPFSEIREKLTSNATLPDDVADWLVEQIRVREKEVGEDVMTYVMRQIMLQVIDVKWKEHLHAMDGLRDSIIYRSYGQRDPLTEYKHEAFQMFDQMIHSIKSDISGLIFKARISKPQDERLKSVFSTNAPKEFVHDEFKPEKFAANPIQQKSGGPMPPGMPPENPSEPSSTIKREGQKVGRNDPCPCGSGKKYKKCHGTA